MDIDSYPEGTLDQLVLAEWEEYVCHLIPFTVFMSLVACFGIIGNVIVITVYSTRYKPSTFRTCLLTLAITDLSSCAIGIPSYIAEERYAYTYRHNEPCVVLATFHFFVLSFSYMMLSFIAVERYRRSCKPLANQITVKESKIICVALAISCLLISFPSVWIHGIVKVKVPQHNVTGYKCAVIDKSSTLTKGYYMVCLLLLLIAMIICGTMYSLVGRVLLKRRQQVRKRSLQMAAIPLGPQESGVCNTISTRTSADDTEETSSRDVIDQLDSTSNPTNKSEETSTTDHNLVVESISTDSDACKYVINKPKHNAKVMVIKKKKLSKKKSKKVLTEKEKRRKRYNKSVRITLMFLVASVLSCLSAIPLLLLRLIGGVDSFSLEIFEERHVSLSSILARFQLLNHVINPVVYCFMDTKFRSESRLFYEKFVQKVSKTCHRGF